MLETSEILIRMIFATLVGLLVGYTRKHKPAGMRTFALVCLGSAIFTTVSLDDLGGDRTRIISQIVIGIGFLGAGVIWKQGARLGGLTTAAALWVTAAVGILVGLGWWVEAVAGGVLALLILNSKQSLIKSGLEED